MILKVNHLEMVQAIEEEGTLTAAARKLYISQPALSRRLSKLEDRIGVALFRRHHRGMTLTPEGRRILQSSGRVLTELRKLEEDVTDLAQGRLGTIRIAVEGYMSYHWLPEVARAFGRSFPGVELRLAPDVTHDPYAALDQGAVDVAIVYGSPPRERDMRVTELFRDELVAVLSSNRRGPGPAFLEAEDFRAVTLICHHAVPDRTVLEQEVLFPAGISSPRTVEMMATPAILETANAGYGIAVLPRWVVDPERLGDGTVVRSLTEEGLWRCWSAVIRAPRFEEPLLRTLLDVLVRTLAPGRKSPHYCMQS